jgi:hypothetical protein
MAVESAPSLGDHEVVMRALAAAKEELGMDVAYLTEFVGEVQTIRAVYGDGASFGLDEGATVELEGSYCQRVIDGRLGSVVPDTSLEPEVAELEATTDAKLGAYVGVPVRFADGALYGTLCAAHHGAMAGLAERDVAFMNVFARMLADTIERDRAQEHQRHRLESVVITQVAERRSSSARLAFSEAELVKRLAMAVEYRDDDTGAHVERVSVHAGELATLAGIDAARVELIRHASPLHDVGKVAIPDAVLLKPGRLTDEERATIETHARIGWELLRGSGAEVLRAAAVIAHSHHEKYDGSGYPQGLVGEEIPIEGRIVAIADVFDALSSDRVYRPAFAPDRVREMMRNDRGTHFDPVLLDAFLESR